jgi:hypothetical protein
MWHFFGGQFAVRFYHNFTTILHSFTMQTPRFADRKFAKPSKNCRNGSPEKICAAVNL